MTKRSGQRHLAGVKCFLNAVAAGKLSCAGQRLADYVLHPGSFFNRLEATMSNGIPVLQMFLSISKAPNDACRYISHAELASVSSYMRGRLTIETVNAALDDAASHSEANHRLMAAARSNSVKPADRKRATTLLHCVAVCHCLPLRPPPNLLKLFC